VVGIIGLLMLSVSEEVGWMLCAGTVGTLVLVTLLMKKVDVRRPGQIDVGSSHSEEKKAA
jgi:hypothetical protein